LTPFFLQGIANNIPPNTLRYSELRGLDPLQLTLFDESHSEGDEERWITLGQAESGTVLVVVHTHRDINGDEVLIRLISARPATPREQRQYQGG
jgi:uncharacterized DUF497 family protein